VLEERHATIGADPIGADPIEVAPMPATNATAAAELKQQQQRHLKRVVSAGACVSCGQNVSFLGWWRHRPILRVFEVSFPSALSLACFVSCVSTCRFRTGLPTAEASPMQATDSAEAPLLSSA